MSIFNKLYNIFFRNYPVKELKELQDKLVQLKEYEDITVYVQIELFPLVPPTYIPPLASATPPRSLCYYIKKPFKKIAMKLLPAYLKSELQHKIAEVDNNIRETLNYLTAINAELGDYYREHPEQMPPYSWYNRALQYPHEEVIAETRTVHLVLEDMLEDWI